MGLKETWTRELQELFTGFRTRTERRECEFHLKVAAPLRKGALSHDTVLWTEYMTELERAVASLPTKFEARWLRCEALHHYFSNLRPNSKDPKARRYARMWDTDLGWLLTHFPEREPQGTSLKETRRMREEFERLCRGYKLN